MTPLWHLYPLLAQNLPTPTQQSRPSKVILGNYVIKMTQFVETKRELQTLTAARNADNALTVPTPHDDHAQSLSNELARLDKHLHGKSLAINTVMQQHLEHIAYRHTQNPQHPKMYGCPLRQNPYYDFNTYDPDAPINRDPRFIYPGHGRKERAPTETRGHRDEARLCQARGHDITPEVSTSISDRTASRASCVSSPTATWTGRQVTLNSKTCKIRTDHAGS